MRNRYFEVLRTYWRRLISSWTLGFCVFPQFILAISIIAPVQVEHLLPVAMVIAFIGGPMWAHFREQIVDERRRHLPDFLTPHVVIFGSLLAFLTLAWPWAMIIRGGTQSIGLMAYATALTAFVGLWVLNPLPHLIIVGVIAWTVIAGSVRSFYFQPFLTGAHEPWAMAVLFGSLITIGLTILRMTRLTEEDPAYHRRLRTSSLSLKPRMTGEGNQAWVDAQGRHRFGLLRVGSGVFAPAGNSVWAGARRWLSLSRGMAWTFLFMAILMVGGVELITRPIVGRSTPLTGTWWLMFFPATMVFGSWLQRWRFMETELLRPIDRAVFLKQVGLAIAINVLQGWGAMALVIAADVLLLSHVDWKVAGYFMGAMFAIQPLGFGVAIWMMRHRSNGSLLLGHLAAVIVPGSMLLILMNEPDLANYHIHFLAGAVVLGMIGLVITRDAYRRWMVAELGI